MFVTEYNQLNEMVHALKMTKLFFFDTETNGLYWSQGHRPCGLSFRTNGVSWYVPLRHKEGINLEPEKVYNALKPVFEDPAKTSAGQNIKFDVHGMLSEGMNFKNKIADIMLAAHFINENESSFKLENLADKYLGPNTSIESQKLDALLKANKMGKGDIWKLPSHVVAPYAEADVFMPDELWNKIYKPVLMKAPQKLRDLLIEIFEYERVITDIERNGFLLDMERLQLIKNEASQKLNDMQIELEKLSWAKFNPNSYIQVRKLLGVHATDRKSLQKAKFKSEAERRAANEIIEYRMWSKALNTYYSPFEEAAIKNGNNTIYPNFFLAGTVTGRLSCKEPNLQAIPRDTENIYKVKQLIIAPEGKTLLSADYSQAELRLLAHYTREPAMVKIFQDGKDIHSGTAAEMNVTRQVAKGINFGIVYGIGAEELARNLSCSVSLATEYLKTYHAKFPSIRKLYNHCQNMAYSRRYISMWTGRQRHFNCPKAEEWKAMSNLIQGGIGEIMRVSIIRLHKYYKNEGVKILNQVHDDIIYDIDDKILKDELPVISNIMRDFKFLVPMAAEMKIGHRWSELKVVP